MIKELWNKIRGYDPNPKPVPETKKESNISFIVTADGGLDIDAGWCVGQEEAYAKLIYAINSGVLLKSILVHLELISKTFDCDPSYKLIVGHLNNLYTEEHKLLEELKKANEDDPIVSPSAIFHNDEDKDEGEELL